MSTFLDFRRSTRCPSGNFSSVQEVFMFLLASYNIFTDDSLLGKYLLGLFVKSILGLFYTSKFQTNDAVFKPKPLLDPAGRRSLRVVSHTPFFLSATAVFDIVIWANARNGSSRKEKFKSLMFYFPFLLNPLPTLAQKPAPTTAITFITKIPTLNICLCMHYTSIYYKATLANFNYVNCSFYIQCTCRKD